MEGLGTLLLALVALPFIFPFWWMITSSLKTPGEIFGALSLFPKTFEWKNYLEAFSYQPFGIHYLNSLYIAAIVTGVTVFLASLSGYALAKVRFPGRSALFLVLLSSMMMPAQVTIIPNFFIMKHFNLINTHIPIILLGIFGAQGAFSTFVMRQYFLSVPSELESAAQIDGLGRFGIFLRIMMPVAIPAAGSITILALLNSWNTFLEPLVFLNDLRKFTLPLSLNNFRDAYGSPVWQLQMAATTLSVLPILLFYILAQKKITNAMVFSGMKG
jgi:multiple sugar transport system permease protein